VAAAGFDPHNDDYERLTELNQSGGAGAPGCPRRTTGH